MKKRLRFQLPHVPLKVLRGEKDQEDVWDRYHERFQDPGSTTEDAEDDKVTDDDSRRRSLSSNDVSTDIGEVSEEGRARYLGGNTSSIGSINQADGTLDEWAEVVHNDQRNNTGDQITNSMISEAIEMQVFKQVQIPPDTGDIDDDGPLTNDTTSYISNALSTDDAASYLSNALSTDDVTSNISSVGSEGSLGSQHSAIATARSDVASHEGVWNLHNNTRCQTSGSDHNEAIELQVFTQVQHMPNAVNTDNDALSLYDNVQDDALSLNDSVY